jgi:tetratricopeptide (TPR) repeat protein
MKPLEILDSILGFSNPPAVLRALLSGGYFNLVYLETALAFIFLLWLGLRLRRAKDLPLTEKQERRMMLKRARKFARRGNYLNAGKIYQHLGMEEKALQHFIRAKAHMHTAELLMKLNMLPEAAEYYEAAMEYASAAGLHVKLNDHEKAADDYIKAGQAGG